MKRRATIWNPRNASSPINKIVKCFAGKKPGGQCGAFGEISRKSLVVDLTDNKFEFLLKYFE